MTHHDELRSGASNDEEYDAVFGRHGDGGITRQHAERIADSILADERRYGGAPPSTPPEPMPRRNRHLDGFGGRNNA